MFHLPQLPADTCPYRRVLGVTAKSGNATWFSLLGVTRGCSPRTLELAWQDARTKANQGRIESFAAIWDEVMDNIDRAYFCLSDETSRREYEIRLDLGEKRSVRVPVKESRPTNTNAKSNTNTTSKSKPKVKAKQHRFQQSGRYTRLRTLGRGSRGTVIYEAHDKNTGRSVAIRQLTRNARTKELTVALQAEAEFLAGNSHPHIVEIYSAVPDRHMMIMELLPTSVEEALHVSRNTGCDPDAIRKFLTEALKALSAIHRQDLIHGGISEKSFRYTAVGVAKLIEPPKLEVGGAFRRPGSDCLAPELLSPGTFGSVGPAVDVYMLGFLALRLLAGPSLNSKVPALGSSEDATYWHASDHEALSAVAIICPKAPTLLCEVIDKMCRKKVSDRFANADEVLDALDVPTSGAIVNDGHRVVATRESEPVWKALADPSTAWRTASQSTKTKLLTALAIVVVGLAALSNPDEPALIADSRGNDLEWGESDSGAEDAATQTEEQEAPDLIPEPIPEEELPVLAANNDTLVENEAWTDEVEVTSTATVAQVDPQEAIEPPDPADNSEIELPTYIPPVSFAGGLPEAEAKAFAGKLRQLSFTQNVSKRREMFERLAVRYPHDPRLYLANFAACGFAASANEHLAKAIALADKRSLPYLQPYRISVEISLRSMELPAPCESPDSDDYENLDGLLHSVSRYNAAVRRMKAADQSDLFYWTGTVCGFLESATQQQPGLLSVVQEHSRRLKGQLNDRDNYAFENGYDWSLRNVGSSMAATVLFPPTPKAEMTRCIETLPGSAAHQRTDSEPKWAAFSKEP